MFHYTHTTLFVYVAIYIRDYIVVVIGVVETKWFTLFLGTFLSTVVPWWQKENDSYYFIFAEIFIKNLFALDCL